VTPRKCLVSALVSGLLFALGLGLSGMADAAKVLGFLDVTGDWDPALALVMVGAVTTYAIAFQLLRRRRRPLWAQSFDVPANRAIDRRLLAGAALFGIGWGMSGLCPGPALVNLASGATGILAFVAAMAAGSALYRITTDGR
jgi:uncharacterized membrane protein YedE/YeeE